jgi:hypothetical protein
MSFARKPRKIKIANPAEKALTVAKTGEAWTPLEKSRSPQAARTTTKRATIQRPFASAQRTFREKAGHEKPTLTARVSRRSFFRIL